MAVYADKKVCVFCGSNVGDDLKMPAKMQQLANYLCAHNDTLVYGGGRLGLMGKIYQDIIAQGGKVIGVIPEILKDHAVRPVGQTTLYYVSDMSARKQKMIDEADCFVVFPGGLGTMEEFFQVYSWFQLGLVQKPIILVNLDGYYDDLLKFLEHSAKTGFMPKANVEALIVGNDFEELFEKAADFKYVKANKWRN